MLSSLTAMCIILSSEYARSNLLVLVEPELRALSMRSYYAALVAAGFEQQSNPPRPRSPKPGISRMKTKTTLHIINISDYLHAPWCTTCPCACTRKGAQNSIPVPYGASDARLILCLFADARLILRLFIAGLFGQSVITLQPDILDVIKGKADVRRRHPPFTIQHHEISEK